MFLGSGLARIGNERRGADKRGAFRLAEAFAREFVFLGYLSLIGKDFTGTESKALGKCPPSTHGYTACAFIFGSGLSDTRSGEARGDGAASSFVRSRSREIFSSLAVGASALLDMGFGEGAPGGYTA